MALPKLKPNAPAPADAGWDMAQLLPWYATGTLTPEYENAIAAECATNSDLASELSAVLAEQQAVVALNEALGAPSARPLLALFAAIEADDGPLAPNVTRLPLGRLVPRSHASHCPADSGLRKKIGRR